MNMLRAKRGYAKILHSHDEPPKLSSIDNEISRHQGMSVAIEATRETLQASKNLPTPSLSKIIEQRTWENGRLRKELVFQQRKNAASIYLLEEVKETIDSLQHALLNFQKLNSEAAKDNEERETEPEIQTIHAR